MKRAVGDSMADMKTIAMDTVSSGKRVRIESIDAGQGLANRLAAMGLFKNEEVSVIRNDGTGQIIIGVKNSRVILGRGMSHKVLVSLI